MKMALVSMRQLLDHAAENIYGVPAFNVNNLEQSGHHEAAALLEHRDSRQVFPPGTRGRRRRRSRCSSPDRRPGTWRSPPRVTSTGDRVCATDRRAGHRHGQAMRALGKRIQFEYAERRSR